MRYIISYTIAATLAVGAVASGSHHHHHHHRHVKKDAGSEVAGVKPDVVTHLVPGAIETVYELSNGKVVDDVAASIGLQNGEYVVVGQSNPTPPPPPPPKPTTTSKAKSDLGAQFMESKSSKPTTTATPPKPKPKPAPPVAKPEPKPAPKPKPVESNSQPSSGGKGLNAKFPSGKVSCNEFPSDYGAIPIDYLGLDGFIGIQKVEGYSLLASVISGISNANPGSKCEPGSMCSYACPLGYQKSQWPRAQGSTGQSIGGLYCSDDGFLELTRTEESVLCIPGAGGVSILNDLDELVSTCRTDYPGYEAMTIPAVANAGEKIPLTNPDQGSYYHWVGHSKTSAQYYVNPPGLGPKDACCWTSPTNPESAGNWAAVNIGVGKDTSGITYLSIFLNLPTSNAKPSFNIEIKGDVNSECSLIDGKFSGGGNGCTTGMPAGGTAYFRYFN